MIADLKPYEEYKDSGLPWLGQVPGHWEVRRAKFLLCEVDARSQTGKEQLLRVSQYTGVTQRQSLDGSESPDTRAASLVGYKHVQSADLVINIMLAWNGSMGVSRYDGIASPAYCVYRFNDDAMPWYYHELLRSSAYKQRIKTASTGVVESRLRLYSDDLGRIELPLPPLAEQAAIVRFLDWATGRLERAIRAKRKVIALLNEQKQAIIHRAVTRGLDPNAPLKDSGIPWLGKIPEHWDILPLVRVLKERIEKNDPVKTDNILSLSLHDGVIPYGEKRAGGNKAKEDLTAYRLAYPGDIVLNSMNVVVGSVGLSKYFGAVSPVYYMLRPRSAADAVEFFDALFHDPAFQRSLFGLGNGIMYIQSRATGKLNTIRMRIPMGKLNRVDIPYPPANEQAKIVQGIATDTARLDSAISRLAREIELLREYHTRLVADVVTGKLDVREAAAKLPDEEPSIAEPDEDTEIDMPEDEAESEEVTL